MQQIPCSSPVDRARGVREAGTERVQQLNRVVAASSRNFHLRQARRGTQFEGSRKLGLADLNGLPVV
ncbi:MAG: hypothetical protein ABIR94_04510 [Rubrivivax sp.]